jgi:hypothetical protein
VTSSALTSLPAIRSLAGAAREQALRQDAVATTAQLQSWGWSLVVTARRGRAGDLQRVFHGVIALQSGPLTWRQRARGALLYAGAGAALSHRSAAYVREVLPSPGPDIHVVVPHRRTVARQPGLVVHRRRDMPWAGGGLRAVDAEEAVVCIAAQAAGDDELVGLVCDAVRGGARPDVLLRRAAQRERLRHRRLLVDVLDAVDDGIESPLELRYRRDVERAHGLPRAVAQKRERVGGRWIRADRMYEGFGVRAELDGQLAHPYGTTDDDVWRDNSVVLATTDVTLRYRWRHVAITPCATAAQVAAALAARGWQGLPHPCGPTCALPT